MSGNESGPMIAMVALHDDRVPDPQQFADSYTARYPGGAKPSNIVMGGETASTITMNLGGDVAAVSLMPGPIPWSDLEGPCETAFWWPEAADELRRHSYHAIIALMGESGNSQIERAVLVSHLASAALQTFNACGVYWCSGTLVYPPEMWLEHSETLAPQQLQPHLWIDMTVEQLDEGGVCLFTTGLEDFGCLEIEVARSTWHADDVHELAYGIVHYVLQRQESIPHGELVGRTEGEKIRVEHRDSIFEGRGKVMQLLIP